jgi:hypothetical protein
MNSKTTKLTAPILIAVVAMLTGPVQAQEMPLDVDVNKMLSEKYKGKSYSPYAKREFPNLFALRQT